MKTDWARLREQWRENGLGRLLLAAASWAYGVAMRARRFLFERRVLKSRKLRAKVVSIGNLTTGGTGKTPAVLLAAQSLRKRNVPVAILSRGYGRAVQGERVTTLLDDSAPPWTECGDEPWMMHHALMGQNVPILVAADRAKAGAQAVDFYHSKLIILDDGFQHLKLQRDLDIVLVNATDPFGGGAMLPLGNLREPPTALGKAGMIVITHADAVSAEELDRIKDQLRAFNAHAPLLEAAHKPDFLLDPRSGQRLKLPAVEGKKVVSLCGLADPASFEALLGRIGADIAQRWRFPDHYPFTLADLESIARVAGPLPIVTTFKDFTRMPAGWESRVPGDLLVLAIKLDIVKGRNVWIDTLLKLAGATAALLLALTPGVRADPGVRLSTAIADPHSLVGNVLPASTDYQRLSAFPERLLYDVSWGIIGVGGATLEVEDVVEFNGRPAYHIVSRATSNHFCDGFYKVRDLNESWMDAKTLSSLGYSKQLREGHFYRNEWVLNHDGKWLGKWAGRDGNFSVQTGTAPVGVQDILSSMYFLRGKSLDVGQEIVLDVNTRQNWALVVRVLKKEKVKTEAGRFDAFLVEPALRHEGIFIQKGNRLRIWLSDDPKHVPVMMKVEVFFGSITAKLVKMIY